MSQSAAGSSAEPLRIPNQSASHLIFFCDQCGFRIPAADLTARKARLLDETRATCVNCSHKRSSATAALRPADGTTRRSTKSISVLSRSDSRSSGHDLASAMRDEPTATHQHAVDIQPERKKPSLWLPVGLGAALLIVILVGVMLVRRPAPVETANVDRTAENVTKPAVVPLSLPPPSVSGPITKDSAKPAVVDEPKTVSSSKDEYDPRAMVAASLLAQAKAQRGATPEELLEYKTSLEKIKESYAQSPAAIEAERLLGEIKNLPQAQDLLDSIPDAKGYQLVYDLNLARVGWSANYTVDRRAEITQPFDRIAYFLELKPNNGPKQYVFVSMDAFTDDLGKIGVPTHSSKAFFQQKVTNMNVASNVEGIVTGTGLSSGNIEFWPNNYGQANSANIPNAASDRFDFGDQPSDPVDGYGSMQVHNYEAKQTIFALNHWREGGNADLGIGNRPSGGDPDWTFSGSSRTYRSKRLRVFVHLK